MIVHPGARDVLTWAVERESATVTEAHAATERTICTSRRQAAMATWNELSMLVPMKWRLKVREVVHWGPPAGEPVRPREMSAPSDGGEEAVAPRVPPVPSKPTQAEQDEHHVTGLQPIVRSVNTVSEVVDVCHHT